MNIIPVVNLNSVNNYYAPKKVQKNVAQNPIEPQATGAIPYLDIPFKAHIDRALVTRTNGVSRTVAMDINKIAKEIQPEIERFMRGIFAGYICEGNELDNLVAYIKGRAKGVDSIVEKSNVIGENTKNGVFRNMTDLNAVKIVLTDGSRKNVHKALGIILDAIKKGLLIMEEVEVKRPKAAEKLKPKDASKWDYEDPSKLEQFVNDASRAMDKDVIFPEPDLTNANYPAIHFLFRLPGQKRVFECQLTGLNIANIKDLDDIIFKVLDNKNVDPKYAPIVDVLTPIVLSKEEKAFSKYIKIREKLDKLKFTPEEKKLLLNRVMKEQNLIYKSDTQEFINKVASLIKSKDVKEKDLYSMADYPHFDGLFQDKEYMKDFKRKLDMRSKFDKYRGDAFLFQREKKTIIKTKTAIDYFLPLSVDLPECFDLNHLYKLYLECKAK